MPLEDLHSASQQLMEALHIRERYMRVSHQSFPTITSKFFHKKHHRTQDDVPSSSSGNGPITSTSDVIDPNIAVGDQSSKSEIKQPYPRARVIKHEDRQSIAGTYSCSQIIIIVIINNNDLTIIILYSLYILLFCFCFVFLLLKQLLLKRVRK